MYDSNGSGCKHETVVDDQSGQMPDIRNVLQWMSQEADRINSFHKKMNSGTD